MTETASIYKGDTGGPWNVGHRLDDGSLTPLTVAYTCKIRVAGAAIERAVTDKTADNLRFIAALTPTETNDLAAGQYVVAVEVENAALTPPLRAEKHIILTVNEHIVGSTFVPDLGDRTAELREELRQVRAARLSYFTGGVVQKARGGRYATEMWYAAPKSLAEYDAMIATLEREIAIAEAVAAGKPKRGAIGLYWNH